MLKINMSDKEYLEYKRNLLKNEAENETARIRSRAESPHATLPMYTWYPRKNPFTGSYTEQIVADAENVMKNLYILPGTDGKLFDVGNPPAWKECRVNDEEYLWSLARMPGIPSLTEAYILTGEKRYAEKALTDTIDFIDTCPPFPLENLDNIEYIINSFSAGTTNPWRQLETGIRMENSMRMLYLRILRTDIMTPEAHSKLAKSFYEHAAQLSAVSSILWPDGAHNHFLTEMAGLLSAACLFPEFDKSEEWLSQAISGLEKCAKAQITPCGAQLEGSPHYHNICVSTFLGAIETASSDTVFSDDFMNLIKKAISYSAWMFAPDGNNSSIGDSPNNEDSLPELINKVYECKINDTELENVSSLLHSTPVSVPEAEFKKMKEKSLNAEGGIRHYPDVGQIAGRTGYTRDDSWFTMICYTPVFNGHAHMDPMSFELNLKGRPVVSDPSFFTYAECPERKKFKLADYHSCLIFGDRMPFEYLSRWTYGAQKEGKTIGVYKGDGFIGGAAIHSNYEPNKHSRLVLLLGDDTFVVADNVKNVTHETVKMYFHMHDAEFIGNGNEFLSGKLRVLLPANCEYESLPSSRSIHTDVTVPSTRLIACDNSGNENAAYITVFTLNETVTEPTVMCDEEKLTVSLSRNNHRETYSWYFPHGDKDSGKCECCTQ